MIDELFELGLDVVDLSEIAALDLEAADIAHQRTGKHHIRGIALEFHHALVHEIAPHIAVGRRCHQRETVVHVVDHGSEDRARAIDLGGSLLYLVEQAHGFDRNHRLVGER